MAISARYEQYDINSAGKRLTTQSIVECRLNDWSENKILAVNASVALTGAEVVSGEIRYGRQNIFFRTRGNAGGRDRGRGARGGVFP